jgi:type VI secretion system secreted protein Hcp
MALDMFLVIKGEISGETQDKKFAGEKGIDILAWSWGMSQSGSFHTGGGGGAGKVNVQDLSVTKWIDKASPTLMLYCSNGDHFAEAKLVIRKAGKVPLEYLTIIMKKVLITSISTGGSGGEDKLTENISFNFAEVEVNYIEQKATGEEGEKPSYKWDIAGNVAG